MIIFGITTALLLASIAINEVKTTDIDEEKF